MRKYKKLSSSLAILGLILASCQISTITASSDTKANEITTASDAEKVNHYKEDLFYIAEVIKTKHPNPYRVISEVEFDQNVERIAASFSPVSTKRDFLWAAREVLASIGCGHSNMGYFNQEDSLITIEERFPLDVRYHNGELFVLDPLVNNQTIKTGLKISKINGIKTDKVLENAFSHIGSDNNFSGVKIDLLNAFATSYLTYALNFPESYSVTIEGINGDIALTALEEFKFKPIIPPSSICQSALCYNVDEKRNVGILTFRHFNYYGEESQIFVDLVDNAFEDLSLHKRNGLIIDMSMHNGGSGLAGAYILRRISEKPFAYFSHQTDEEAPEALFEIQVPKDTGFNEPVTVIMSGATNSSAPHFFAIVKEHGLATLIGQPAGGHAETYDGARWERTPHLGVEFKVATMQFVVDTPSVANNVPIQPDILVDVSTAQALSREDVLLKAALDLYKVRDVR